MTDSLKMKWAYRFDEACSLPQEFLGNKGSGLRTLTRLGLPVPDGFTITKEVSKTYLLEKLLPEPVWEEIIQQTIALGWDENQSATFPILLAVRSGASVSMPGMLDSILNVGLSWNQFEQLIQSQSMTPFICEVYYQFLRQYLILVQKYAEKKLDLLINKYLAGKGIYHVEQLSMDGLRELCRMLVELSRSLEIRPIPDDRWKQLRFSIEAIIESWNNPRAIQYRETLGISHDLGTSFTIMKMVHANCDQNSGSGVLFTRHPVSGVASIYGEFLPTTLGLEIVGGELTPESIDTLKVSNEAAYLELNKYARLIEYHYKQIQEIEFTIEAGNLWILQTRKAVVHENAKMMLIKELIQRGEMSHEEASTEIKREKINKERVSYFSEEAKKKAVKIGQGLPASHNVVVGQVCFTVEEIRKTRELGPIQCILVRPKTKTQDIEGIEMAAGIVTQTGGVTSHAAVVARLFQKPCVVGCESWEFLEENGEVYIQTLAFKLINGSIISVDGNTGEIFLGDLLVGT